MPEVLVLAIDRGVVVCGRDTTGWQVESRTVLSHPVTSIEMPENLLLAGTTDGIYRSEDGGKTWRESCAGLTVRYIRWLARHPDQPERVFAGTEPANIFVSEDAGGSWRECAEVASLRTQHGWWLPYSPGAGCVRSFAFHGPRAYAAVEVGGVLRSDDWGAQWRLAAGSTGRPVFDLPAAPLIHADVHSVVTHACSPELVFAATAAGLYCSEDGGETWSHPRAGCYTRAVWVDPEDAAHLILGVADSVEDHQGRIEQSRDGGRSWQLCSDGLSVPWPDQMVERFLDVDGELLAIRSDGQVFAARPDILRWQHILAGTEPVNAAVVGKQR